MGTAAASAGAAGPSEGLRAGLSSGRTKPEYTAVIAFRVSVIAFRVSPRGLARTRVRVPTRRGGWGGA
jgi:hypothetical protein